MKGLDRWIGNGRRPTVRWAKRVGAAMKLAPTLQIEAQGPKKSLLTDRGGGPLSRVLVGANVHDAGLSDATIQAIVVKRPRPPKRTRSICAWTKASLVSSGYLILTGLFRPQQCIVRLVEEIGHIRGFLAYGGDSNAGSKT